MQCLQFFKVLQWHDESSFYFFWNNNNNNKSKHSYVHLPEQNKFCHLTACIHFFLLLLFLDSLSLTWYKGNPILKWHILEDIIVIKIILRTALAVNCCCTTTPKFSDLKHSRLLLTFWQFGLVAAGQILVDPAWGHSCSCSHLGIELCQVAPDCHTHLRGSQQALCRCSGSLPCGCSTRRARFPRRVSPVENGTEEAAGLLARVTSQTWKSHMARSSCPLCQGKSQASLDLRGEEIHSYDGKSRK